MTEVTQQNAKRVNLVSTSVKFIQDLFPNNQVPPELDVEDLAPHVVGTIGEQSDETKREIAFQCCFGTATFNLPDDWDKAEAVKVILAARAKFQEDVVARTQKPVEPLAAAASTISDDELEKIKTKAKEAKSEKENETDETD